MGPVASQSGTPRCSELGRGCEPVIVVGPHSTRDRQNAAASAVGLRPARHRRCWWVASRLLWACCGGLMHPILASKLPASLKRRNANRMGFRKIAMRGSEYTCSVRFPVALVSPGRARGSIGTLEAVLGLDASKPGERRPNRHQAAGIGCTLPACSPPHQTVTAQVEAFCLVHTVLSANDRDGIPAAESGLVWPKARVARGLRVRARSPPPRSPSIPPRPSSATACRKEEAVARSCRSFALAGKQQSTAPQLHMHPHVGAS